MQVGDLVKYAHAMENYFGVVVGIEKPTRRLGGGPVYRIQWIKDYPLVRYLEYLQSDSLYKVAS